MKMPLLIGLATTLVLATKAQSLVQPVANTASFAPTGIAQYAPRTAPDSVSQMPGFRITGGDGDEARSN